MFEKIKITYSYTSRMKDQETGEFKDGPAIVVEPEKEFFACRMPHVERAKMLDRLRSATKETAWEVGAQNQIKHIVDTIVDEQGNPVFKSGYPADRKTWGDDSVKYAHPQLWDGRKVAAYAKACEEYQNPKLEDVAKNSGETTSAATSSVSQSES